MSAAGAITVALFVVLAGMLVAIAVYLALGAFIRRAEAQDEGREE